MVRHIVFWKLKPEAEGGAAAGNGARIKQGLERLVGVIEGLQKLEVMQGFTETYDLALISEFTDRAALEYYQKHPEHDRVRQFVHKVIETRAAFDAEL